jgi:hypothetical protein
MIIFSINNTGTLASLTQLGIATLDCGVSTVYQRSPNFNQHKKGSADHAAAPQSFPAASSWLFKKRLSQAFWYSRRQRAEDLLLVPDCFSH